MSGSLQDSWTLTSVAWGDATTTSPAISTAGPFSLAHTYTKEGSMVVIATITDSAGTTATSQTTAAVTDVAPTITSAALASSLVQQGTTTTLDLTWDDPGADSHTVTVTITSANGFSSVTSYGPWGTDSRSASLPITGLGPGLYALAVTVEDAADASTKAQATLPGALIVYDPAGGDVQGTVSPVKCRGRLLKLATV